jgi:CheY-like chemotaxis protein
MRLMKVLVVDDDEFFIDELADFFRRQGCSVVTGASGEDALQLTLAESPDLLVMDIHMPVLDGVSAARELQRNGAALPRIVLMSGDRGGIAEAEGISGVTVLEKPLDVATLKRLVGA